MQGIIALAILSNESAKAMSKTRNLYISGVTHTYGGGVSHTTYTVVSHTTCGNISY